MAAENLFLSVIAGLIGVLLTVVLRLLSRVTGLAGELKAGISQVRADLSGTRHQFRVELMGLRNGMLLALSATGVLPSTHLVTFMDVLDRTAKEVVEKEREAANPLTSEELQRFEELREKLIVRREPPTEQDVQDWDSITWKLMHEKPNDPTAGLLWFFGGMLTAMLVLKRWKSREDKPNVESSS